MCIREELTDLSIDIIFEIFDGLFKKGEFERADDLLLLFKPDMHTPIVLAALTITAAAKSKLKNRKALFGQTKKSYLEKYGEEKTKGLLGGLE